MKSLIWSRIFAVSYFFSYTAFLTLTMYFYDFVEDGIGAGHSIHGFPFGYYYSHCFGGNYLWVGFLGNLTVAALISLFIGLLVSQLYRKFSSPEFRTKWYL